MRITHSRDKSDEDNFKDLGVIVTKDLSWGNRISITVNKGSKVLGSIKRSVGISNTDVFFYVVQISCSAYYGICGTCLIWCPYLVKDIHALENVQRRASRLALNQRKGDLS